MWSAQTSQKFYRQILIQPEDQKLQVILWIERSSEPIRTYKLNTVTYGLACAPFLAISCLHEIAHKFSSIYPEATNMILKDIYVDNLLTGFDNVQVLTERKMIS